MIPFEKGLGETQEEWLACLIYCGMSFEDKSPVAALEEVFGEAGAKEKYAEGIVEKYNWKQRLKLYQQTVKARVESDLFSEDLRKTHRNHQLAQDIGRKISEDYLAFCQNNPERLDDSDHNVAARTRLYLTQANSIEADLDFRLSGMKALLDRYRDELE